MSFLTIGESGAKFRNTTLLDRLKSFFITVTTAFMAPLYALEISSTARFNLWLAKPMEPHSKMRNASIDGEVIRS